MPTFHRVCRTEDVPDGEVRLLEADGTKIALCRRNEKFFALSNFCPHLTGNLGEGTLEGDELVCPEHFWRFKIHSGRCVSMPNKPAHTFPVQIEDGWVLVGL